MDNSLLESSLTFSDEPFASLLDARILRSLADLSFTHPTLVQAQAIPLVLQGKDVLAKARTGSGKTAAYGLPAIQKVLLAKAVSGRFRTALVTDLGNVLKSVWTCPGDDRTVMLLLVSEL
jgi:superfamily II DNA/RNA helicase